MKEFIAQEGGRYMYADDIINLQETALSFGRLFGQDDFIISGCGLSTRTRQTDAGTEESYNYVSPGYVFMNGRVLEFSGGETKYSRPCLVEKVEQESVQYNSGTQKPGRLIRTMVLADEDALRPDVRKVRLDGDVKSFWESMVGKYAVVKGEFGENTSISDDAVSTLAVIAGDGVFSTLTVGDSDAVFTSENNRLVINVNNKCSMYLGDAEGFAVFHRGKAVISATLDGIAVNQPMTFSETSDGSLTIDGSDIFNSKSLSSLGAVNINMLSYNGGKAVSRVTNIGNGKGEAMMSFNGNTGTVTASCPISINGAGRQPFELVADASHAKGQTIDCSIYWKDSDKSSIAWVGFVNSGTFVVSNYIGNVSVKGNEYVDLGPSIRENGTPLSDKYATKISMSELLAKKADADGVYSIDEIKSLYVQKKDGFTAFTEAGVSKVNLREQIEAASVKDLDNYVRKDKLLGDIASSEQNKKEIRNNIDVLSKSEAQKKLYDSGWVELCYEGHISYDASIGTTFRVRRFGDVVYIEGKLRGFANKRNFVFDTLDGAHLSLPKHITAAKILSDKGLFDIQFIGGLGSDEGGFQVSAPDTSSNTIFQFFFSYSI